MKPFLILLILVTSSNAFYTALTSKHVLASFPKTPVYKAMRLVHSPELWADGACIALGVPRFRISRVSPMISYYSDKVIQFYANDTLVSLIAKGRDKVIVKIGDTKGFSVKINHDDNPIGFSLFIELLGCDHITCSRQWIEMTLFALADYDDMMYYFPEFHRWRNEIIE
jgi:hypothetical protein